MKIKFKGGPWDGVKFETEFAPDVIHFRHLVTSGGKNPETGKLRLAAYPTEFHQYIKGKQSKKGDRAEYDYAPGEKAWWEHLEKSTDKP